MPHLAERGEKNYTVHSFILYSRKEYNWGWRVGKIKRVDTTPLKRLKNFYMREKKFLWPFFFLAFCSPHSLCVYLLSHDDVCWKFAENSSFQFFMKFGIKMRNAILFMQKGSSNKNKRKGWEWKLSPWFFFLFSGLLCCSVTHVLSTYILFLKQ